MPHMQLSRPVPRKHLHTHRITCHGYLRKDGLWDIEGTIVDTKTYSFDNQDRGWVRAGDPVHKMSIRLTVDDDRVVKEAEASSAARPFSMCSDITPAYAGLKGLRIAPGWRRAVKEELGEARGCTHITDLLLGPLAATAYQAVRPDREKDKKKEPQKGKRAMLNSCHAMAADSPLTEYPPGTIAIGVGMRK
jgi:hypothetical protein